MSFCKKCGNELTSDAKFCINCGNQVSDENTPIIDNPQNSAAFVNSLNPTQLPINSSKRINKKSFFIILVSAVIFVMILILIIKDENQLKVYDNYFGFDDEEFIDYANDNISVVHIDSQPINWLSDQTKTYYTITYNDDNGLLILDHDKEGRICAIGVAEFDNKSDCFAISALIGKEIDSHFFKDIDDVATDISTDNAYVSDSMTMLGTNGRYILFPNGYLLELLAE